MRIFFLALAALLAAGVAGANQDSANACAKALGKDPRTIYDASIAAVTADTNLKDLLTQKTRGLVEAGTVPRDTARDSARAALKCLELAQQPN
ncbi:MAG: hypothetical protein SF182_00095 [Deltaproteobacteria bacterium]|nr:hypothetical protein [Deltaproteobacteria bacterium]